MVAGGIVYSVTDGCRVTLIGDNEGLFDVTVGSSGEVCQLYNGTYCGPAGGYLGLVLGGSGLGKAVTGYDVGF